MSGTRARLADVARRAGVSKATASRILNADPTFSSKPATREAVLAAASELSYVPHSGARALAGMPTRALLMISPPMNNLSNATIGRGANARAMERGYLTLMVEDFHEPALTDRVMSLADGGRVDGIIVGSAAGDSPIVQRLAEARIPHVFVNRSIADSGRNIVYDFAAPSRVALDALLGRGHRRIGHIAGPEGVPPSDARAEEFRDGAERAGVELFVAESDFSEQGGYDALGRLHERGVTAVFATSLAQGIGALRWATANALRVPSDLSIIANDDMPVAAFTSPALTTVRTPLYEMGAAAADAVIAQIEQGRVEDITIDAAPELLMRETLGDSPHGH